MTDIAPIAASSGGTPEPRASIAGDELGADTFLQLLVAQLKYQDPTAPSDGADFLAQTAQFTMVEKLTELAEMAERSAVVDRNLAAASMVGQSVSWLNDDGTTGAGVVDSARLGSAGPVLVVGAEIIPFDVVTAVSTPPAPAAPTTDPAQSPEEPEAQVI